MLLWLFGGLLPLGAQAVDASIRGQVSDPSGGAIVGAKVRVKDQATGFSRGTLSNGQGFYV
ncbi:MAG: carboxypeptidase-like regulatory domain-containing protein, partial [bacterium]